MGQTERTSEKLRIPVRGLDQAQPDQQMMEMTGFISSAPPENPLAHYQRSRLRRWEVEREVDAKDSVVGIELTTPAGPIRIRYDVLIEGKSFRAGREKTVDQLLAIAHGQSSETALEEASKGKARMVAYAKSRGDRATRYELRRRIADLANGPALLWTSQDFAADRIETHILFALIDADEDGVISTTEIESVDTIFNRADTNSDNRIELTELHSRLKPRSARRKSKSQTVGWRSWDANQSEHAEDLGVHVGFNKTLSQSILRLDDCVLAEPWEKSTAGLSPIGGGQESVGQAILLSHPTVTIALAAVAEAPANDTNQISVGVTAEGNALFRHLDQDANQNLSQREINEFRDQLLKLDRNADQAVDVSELPVLLRVGVARGAVVHQTLQERMAIVRSSEDSGDSRPTLVAPEWFYSMDQDEDRMLSRTEFLGGRDAFDGFDKDKDELISVKEALKNSSE